MAVKKISRKAIQDGRDQRHRKVFGPKKAQLICKPADFSQFRVLPDFNPAGRGANEDDSLFYFSELGHWVTLPNEDDPKAKKTHPERWTCWPYLIEEQPRTMRELRKKKQWNDESCRCLFCEVLDNFSGDYDSLPQDKYGVEFKRDKSHNMTVLITKKDYEEQEDDPYPVKIFPAKATALEAILEIAEEYGNMIDETVGREIKVQLAGTAYRALPVAKATKVWLHDWKKKAQDLELNSLQLHSYEEQREYFKMREWDHLLAADGQSAKRTATRKKVAEQKKGRKKAAAKVSKKKVAKKKTSRKKK